MSNSVPVRPHRPPSSASLRPPSAASHRPPSAASHRPPSVASHRPPSVASQRAYSRLSQHPTSSRNTRSRLLPLCQTLVTQITGLKENTDSPDEAYTKAVDYALKNLESTTMTKGGFSVHLDTVTRQIKGHAQKARINSRDAIAQALETSLELVKTQVAAHDDLDADVKLSRLSDHITLLLQLSTPSTPVTLARAETYLHSLANPPTAPPALTWAEILKDEPFEGQHWEGVYGMPPGSVVSSKRHKERTEDWDSSDEEFDRGSTPSLSPWDSDDAPEDDNSIESEPKLPPFKNLGVRSVNTVPPQTFAHRKAFEDLQKRQYWREEQMHSAIVPKKLDLGNVTSLGPTLRRVMGDARIDSPDRERYITEYDAVREVLMALQGRRNILLTADLDEFTPAKSAPRLMHLSLITQHSILSSFARTATDIAKLRRLVSNVLMQPSTSNAKTTRTLEAFADAIDAEIRTFEIWCANREEAMCRASAGMSTTDSSQSLVVSLLSTEKALNDTFETSFTVLLDIWRDIEETTAGDRRRLPVAAVTARLLDALFERVQEHTERSELVTASTLMRVFVSSAEPVWTMLRTWLRNGMGMSVDGITLADELEDEFFIESSGLGMLINGAGGGLLDPDFWAEGYSLREHHQNEQVKFIIPIFLEHVAEGVLAAGKAIGLLRALDFPLPVDSAGHKWLNDWRSFTAVLNDTGSISVDSLSRVVYDELMPHCHATGDVLAGVIREECDLFQHVSAIEQIFFMRKGDTMSHFIDIVFAKMDSQQSWSDFHFLNTAFRDVVEASAKGAGGTTWINPSLVRLSYRGSTRDKEKTITRTVKAIDTLLVEYAVPFPLTYIFTPRMFAVYTQVFVFLLQIRRAKSVLEKILVRGPKGKVGLELKNMYAMRSRLSWFVNVMLNFLTTYVIHTQVLKLHTALQSAKSLDEMVQLHETHLERIQARCLLQPNTSALYRAILSILDICLHFTDHFITFAGDNSTHDISRTSMSMSRHRSRRQRKQRRNLMSLSDSIRGIMSDSSSDDSDNEEFNNERDFEPSISVLSSVTEEGKMEKMSVEFDGLVKFVKRGVESFAGGAGDAAPAFGVLAFALEDWDT